MIVVAGLVWRLVSEVKDASLEVVSDSKIDITPERLGLCGAVSWLDAKATNELDPTGPCQIVPKERCIDEKLGRYEDVDEAVAKYSHGALEHVTLYSLFQDPMTSCGCYWALTRLACTIGSA